MSHRGALIVFEGLDRSGKSTQARRLVETINASGGSAILLPFPGMFYFYLDRNEPFGQVIDRYLRKEIDLCERALHLAFSANRWEKAALIEEKIASGVDVICDRYCFSGVAYSIAKGLDSHWVRQADIGLPRPDVVLFFEVSPEVVKQRGGFGDERLENDQLQRKVHTAMETLRKSYWETVDADGDMESVAAVVQEIYSKIPRDKPLSVIDSI
ncbi:dTMP kinase [Necator americanus]|uniref:Thymidylate kinase n=1 Tax=Necator americanus TaxID=51031 RepID=W2T125_NECAM|nr:dTMP kinase [Necator americanus]ETN74677.1 dTMP kinase [Necator americanus]